MEDISAYLKELYKYNSNELFIIGGIILLLLLIIIYFTFFRKRENKKLIKGFETSTTQFVLDKPTKEEILDKLVYFDKFPTFIKIFTTVLNNFTIDYLYSYPEMAKTINILLKFPKDKNIISPEQKGAMATLVRIFMSSEFIMKKCGVVIEENIDNFFEEVSRQ